MLVGSRLEALGHLILEICKISGIPGLSIGVLHQGEVIHQANFGFRDVDAKLPPNENTTYVIASLTKAFTAAMVGMLVDEGSLDWTTQLHDIIPEFRRDERDPASNITISDLLSHRTGLSGYDALWLQSDNRIVLNRSQAVSFLSYVPVAVPLRTEFVYNNMAYEVVGQVIEKLSGAKYGAFLRDRILDPLNISRTFYTDVPENTENTAKAYTTLEDGSPFEIPQPVYGEDVLMGAAGGIRSCAKDMLALYKAFMEAANSQIEHSSPSTPGNPFRQLAHLWRGMIGLSIDSMREFSYASGWVRAELPARMAPKPSSGNELPMLGHGLPSRLMLLHQGNIPGSVSYAALFPETSSAVVVLANSLSLNNAVLMVGQLLIETLFKNTFNSTEYVEYARTTAQSGASFMARVQRELARGKTVDRPTNSLHAYTGRYYNSIGTYFIDILHQGDRIGVSFMGHDGDTFDLEPYQANSFFWQLTHNEGAKRARFTTYPKQYYIIKFGCETKSGEGDVTQSVEMGCLSWKHDGNLPGDGEVFQKNKKIPRHDQTVRKHFLKFLGFE